MIDTDATLAADDSGDGAIADVIVFFALITVLFAALQVVLVYLASATAGHTAGVAASAEAAYGAADGAGEAAAGSFLDQAGQFLVGAQVSLSEDGDQVTATVTGEAVSIFDFPITWSISRDATGQIEQWVPYEGA
jgi:hypothetical protein